MHVRYVNEECRQTVEDLGLMAGGSGNWVYLRDVNRVDAQLLEPASVTNLKYHAHA